MPALNLPNLNFNIDSGTDKQTLEQIVDSLSKYRKELNFLLMNLDTDNMPFIESKLTDIDGNLSSVVQTVDAINLTVGSNTGDISNLQIQANSISSTVAGNTGNISAVTQTANAVTLNFANLKTLTGGQQINNGVTTISPTGIKVQHTNFPGQYSEMRADGFIRQWAYGEAEYLSDIWTEVIDQSSYYSQSGSPSYRVTLPTRFRGRTNVKIVVFPIEFRFDGSDYDTDERFIDEAVSYNSLKCDLVRYGSVPSVNLTNNPPYCDVNAYVRERAYSQYISTGETWYSGIIWGILVVGG